MSRTLHFGQRFVRHSLWYETPSVYVPLNRRAIAWNHGTPPEIVALGRLAAEWCRLIANKIDSTSGDSLDERIVGIRIRFDRWTDSTKRPEILRENDKHLFEGMQIESLSNLALTDNFCNISSRFAWPTSGLEIQTHEILNGHCFSDEWIYVCTISLLRKAITVWAKKRSTPFREPNATSMIVYVIVHDHVRTEFVSFSKRPDSSPSIDVFDCNVVIAWLWMCWSVLCI